MSKLLLNESCLKLLSSLALKIGQSPALVLQKIHFEQSKLTNGDGYSATLMKLHERIRFISKVHLQRILVELQKENLINVTKYKNNKLGSLFSVNHEKLGSLGFKCVNDGIISRNLQREFTLFILPTLAKEFGIPGAAILQQIHYLINSQHLQSIQLTYQAINSWVPFISLRPLKEIFHKFEKNNIIIPELIDQTDRNAGKFYRINYGELNMMTDKPISNVSVDKSIPIINNIIEKSVDKSVPITNDSVDKSSHPDHFSTTTDIISALPPISFQHHLSIDQDQTKIFIKNNNNYSDKIMEQKPKCGTIPTMKDNVVSLKERLMTYKIYAVTADRLLTRFSTSRIEQVLAAASKQQKIDGKPVFGNWIVKALESNWNLKETEKKEVTMTNHIKPEDSLVRRELEENGKMAITKFDAMKCSSEEVKKYYMGLIKGTLRVSESKPESNREFAKRIAPNILEIYSSAESCSK